MTKLPDSVAVNKFRENFSALKNKCYLNFGGQGTMASSTIEAIKTAYEHVQSEGPFTSKIFGWLDDIQKQAKLAFATEFGGTAADYALTQNATEGCNIVLWGLDWNPGERLLTTDCEHNGVVKAAMQICQRQKLHLDICNIANLQSDEQILDVIEAALKIRPRVFMLSHVLWNTGRLLPLEQIGELCRAHGVLLLVDGAQSAGVIPIDLSKLPLDFYAFTGHKWIGGPDGTGALYVSPDALTKIQPTFTGWRGALFAEDGSPIDWAPDATRFEVATSAFPILAGLTDAFKKNDEFSPPSLRYEMIRQMTGHARTALEALPGINLLDKSGDSSLICFTLKSKSASEIVRQLEERNIIIRSIPSPSCARISVHFFSNDDLDKLLEQIESNM